MSSASEIDTAKGENGVGGSKATLEETSKIIASAKRTKRIAETAAEDGAGAKKATPEEAYSPPGQMMSGFRTLSDKPVFINQSDYEKARSDFLSECSTPKKLDLDLKREVDTWIQGILDDSDLSDS